MKNLYVLVALSGLFFSSGINAQTANNVYIDQVGNNSTIDVTQTGSNNSLGTQDLQTILNGNSQNVTVRQIGSNNVGIIDVRGAGATISSDVVGSSNTVTIQCGNGGVGGSNSCADSTITSNITGSNNVVSTTAGAKTTITTNVTGDTNQVKTTSSTTNLLGSRSTTEVTGSSNDITVGQNGPAGANGFESWIQVTGSSNIVGVTQSGTVDSMVNIKTVGSSNNITVRSGN